MTESMDTTEVLPGGWRGRVGALVEGTIVQRFITTLIILNGITLGMETSPSLVERFGGAFSFFNGFVLVVFVVEIVGKFIYRSWRFFLNGWNVFDFLIVAIALVPASGELSVLRSLRVLRILRLLSVIPQMRRVVGALLHALPGMTTVGAIIFLLFYIGAVLATNLYGKTFPEWFGTLGHSFYTLFQVMTLESWSMGIVRPIMEVHPYAWVFFIPFIVITSFAVLNLFIGIIVDSMSMVHDPASTKEEEVSIEQEIRLGQRDLHMELRALRSELAALRQEVAEGRKR